MHAAGVAQNHGVIAVVVLEEIKDAELLHQPGNEVEVGLPVLNAILQLVVRAGEAALVLDSAIVEDRLDDLGDILVMEDPAIGVAGQKPELGHHLQFVAGHVALFAGAGKVAHDAIEVTLGIVNLQDIDGDGLADDGGEIDGRVFRQRSEVKVEQARNGFVAGEPGQ